MSVFDNRLINEKKKLNKLSFRSLLVIKLCVILKNYRNRLLISACIFDVYTSLAHEVYASKIHALISKRLRYDALAFDFFFGI